MSIDYSHAANFHSLPGPMAAFPKIFSEFKPVSLLDVGCGIGTWLKAAQDFGVTDVFGVDGIATPPGQFLVSHQFFRQHDLTRPWDLGRKFDVVICFEVAEHLDEPDAGVLVDALVAHSDWIIFGAACPGQPGQHHVNCRWPDYWQGLFNQRGYVCSDDVRWKIWNDDRIESWYRQNIFAARKDASQAGKEPRIPAVINPAQMPLMEDANFEKRLAKIEQGWLPYKWYLFAPLKALTSKISKRFK